MIGSVSSAVGVLLITAIILAAIVIKRGYIKKFNRRNKVDNIYGGEKQGAHTNAYVNEGNTAQGSELETRDKGFLIREDIWVDRPSESGC